MENEDKNRRPNRRKQKIQIKQTSTAVILIDKLIQEERDSDKIKILKTIRKEVYKLEQYYD